jgi:hypothetical protein
MIQDLVGQHGPKIDSPKLSSELFLRRNFIRWTKNSVKRKGKTPALYSRSFVGIMGLRIVRVRIVSDRNECKGI